MRGAGTSLNTGASSNPAKIQYDGDLFDAAHQRLRKVDALGPVAQLVRAGDS